MVVTTTNSTHKPKDTELEIKNNNPVFKLRLFSLHLCLSLFGADSMIRLKLHIRKEDTLLQNMRRCSCNLVGMSCPHKISCFHKKILQHCSSSYDCTWPPRTIQPLSRPSQHEPLPSPTPQVIITYLLLLNESGHSHCTYFVISESVGPSSAQESNLDSDVPQLP